MFFDSARRKIDRADKHIRDVETAIRSLEGHYVSSIYVDHESSQQSIEYCCSDFEAQMIEISLIAGDAIHNLRTALDYAWIATIRALKLPVTKWTKFPFADSPQALDGTLKKRQVDVANPALFEKITTEIQPYRGGHPYLWSLHDADITDKHKLVLPVVQYSVPRHISIEDERGPMYISGPTIQTSKSKGRFSVKFPERFNIKDKGKVTITVFFEEGSSLAGVPILEELPSLSSSTFAYQAQLLLAAGDPDTSKR